MWKEIIVKSFEKMLDVKVVIINTKIAAFVNVAAATLHSSWQATV